MNVNITRNITINNPMGMPMMGGPMMGPAMTPMSIFGGFGCMPPNNSVAAGYCTGAMLSNPVILRGLGAAGKAIGKAAVWTFNHAIKPFYNAVLKPAGKAIAKGCSWLWNHTLGALFKKKETEQS